MSIRTIRSNRPASLRPMARAWIERLQTRWDEGVSPAGASATAAVVAAVAVLSGVIRPLPVQLHLFVPAGAGCVGWVLARRWGATPVAVLWGLLGLFAGVSAGQRLDSPALILPLAVVGTVVGLTLSASGVTDDSIVAGLEMVPVPLDIDPGEAERP